MTSVAYTRSYMAYKILLCFILTATTTLGSVVSRKDVFHRYWQEIAEGDAPHLSFKVDPSVSKSGRDAYSVKGAKDALFFTGSNERSLWYALYDFFEREGCAYFWDGDRLPEKHAVDIANVNFRSEADKEIRGLRYFAHRSLHRFQAEQWDWDDWSRELEWMLKTRLNFFMLRLGSADLFQRAFPEIVKYPKGYECPEAFAGFNDRTHFWKLEEQGNLREKIFARAREFGLMTAEDTGTPTHWYSRTPIAYLEAVKPKLLTQSAGNYREQTGLVWDVRERKNLDAYFKLTEASIAAYGGGVTPTFFHTIGLGERNYFKDRAKNHAFKLEVYDLIQKRLRESYPDTPLLIGSWDFISTWSPKEVRAFIKTLDPKRTIILDYTSDIFDEYNNFMNWGLVGKFPWIYGIFHAYQASSEIRGNYHDNIHDRFLIAADDPMCKGVIYWPECSHTDTLMIDFFPAIGWETSLCNIDTHLPDFCRRRYGKKKAGRYLKIWQRILPVAERSAWGTQVGDGHRVRPQREIYPDCYFNLHGYWLGDERQWMIKRQEYFQTIDATLGPLMKDAAEALRELADLTDDKDELMFRDKIDLARTVCARAIELAFARMGLSLDAWQAGGDAEPARAAIARVRKLGVLLADILEASEEFSLNASLCDLAKHGSNPDFAKTLKANADNDYCRSYVYEMARYLYLPRFDALAKWINKRMDANNRATFNDTAEEQEKAIEAASAVYREKSLDKMKPNIKDARARLPETLRKLADAIESSSSPFEVKAHAASLNDGLSDAHAFWSFSKYPEMTSPATICVRKGEPFTYQFSYESKKPYEIRAKGLGTEPLPKGLSFDARTGVLSGAANWDGEKFVTFTMNEGDSCEAWGDLKIRVYGAKRVPPSLFNETIYQLDIGNFTKEGTFAAAERELPRLRALGLKWIYLCPITAWDKGTDKKFWSSRQKASGFDSPHNPYRPADFMNVEPTYGTNDDFKRFVASAHSLGLKVMTDVVFFHCGPHAVFLEKHPDWVKRTADGNFLLGEWAFPCLDFENAELRRYLIDSLLMWLREFDVDGFRCDVGGKIPLDFWEAARVEIDKMKKDVVMMLEGAKAPYAEKAFDLFYSFQTCHNGINDALRERKPASWVRRQWEREQAQGPKGVAWMRSTETHDIAADSGENRNEKRWGHKRAECGIALTFALDGVPMLWMGQEIGWDKRYSIFGPTKIDWSEPPVPERSAVIRRLCALKKEPAFGAKGEMVWLKPKNPDDEILFLRRAPDGTTYRCYFNVVSGDWSID